MNNIATITDQAVPNQPEWCLLFDEINGELDVLGNESEMLYNSIKAVQSDEETGNTEKDQSLKSYASDLERRLQNVLERIKTQTIKVEKQKSRVIL